MSISLNQTIQAVSTFDGGGHITVTVTGTNNGSPTFINAPTMLGFQLFDQNGYQDLDIHRDPTPPGVYDMGGPVENGRPFDRSYSFTTGAVQPGLTYQLRCVFLRSGEAVQNTFQFQQVYYQGAS